MADDPPDDFKYIKPKKWNQPGLPKTHRGRYIDDDGNEWEAGPNHHYQNVINPNTNRPYEQEWDVQRPNGKHWNVDPRRGPRDLYYGA